MYKEFQIYTASLSGFLNALQRLTEDRVILFNGHLEIKENIENSLIKYISGWKNESKIIDFKPICYNDFNKLLQEKIYSKISTNEKIIYNINWQLQEYFGLISTSLAEFKF